MLQSQYIKQQKRQQVEAQQSHHAHEFLVAWFNSHGPLFKYDYVRDYLIQKDFLVGDNLLSKILKDLGCDPVCFYHRGRLQRMWKVNPDYLDFQKFGDINLHNLIHSED